MDEQSAKLVIGAGAAIGVVVWLVALQLYRKMAETPAVEVLETPVPGKTPTEAIKSVAENAARLPGQIRLARLAEHVFEISQEGCRTRIAAHRTGGHTMLTAELDDTLLRRKWQRTLALFVVLLMPLSIFGVAAGLWHFAAMSPAPAARWQSLQVMQMVHFLWPPFLLYSLWKRQKSMARDAIANLLVLAETV